MARQKIKKVHEFASRSLVKTLTFRCIVVLADSVVVFAITHRYDFTVGVVVVSNLASTILYYLHERIWNHIHWGRSVK